MLFCLLFTATCRSRRDLSSSAGVASQGSDLVSNSGTCFILSFSLSAVYDRMTVHRNRFLVNKTKRCTEYRFYRYYDSTCFGQPFRPSSGVLSRTSVLVHFMQLWWPFATRSRMKLVLHVSGSLSAHHQEFLAVHRFWYILCSCDKPFATRSRMARECHPTPGSKRFITTA